MAKLVPATSFYKTLKDYNDEYNALLQAIEEARQLPASQLVGQIIKFHVADSYAYYRVVKERPLTLESLSSDYQIAAAHIRGLNADDVRAQVRHQKALDALFSQPKEAR